MNDMHICPHCTLKGLIFEDIRILDYDEFFGDTLASFSVKCRFCGWKK